MTSKWGRRSEAAAGRRRRYLARKAEGRGERVERTERIVSMEWNLVGNFYQLQGVVWSVGNAAVENLVVWGRPFDFLHHKAEAAENQFQTGPRQFVTETRP